MTARQRLPQGTVRGLGLAACGNAYALLDDADALIGSGRHVRGFVLTVMAAEEFAKGFWAYQVLDLGDDESWVSLWSVLGGRGIHQARLATVLALEAMVTRQGGTSQVFRLLGEVGAPDVCHLRNLALYVGIEDGEVSPPRELKDSAVLRELTLALRKSVAVWTIIVDGSLEALETD